MTDPTPTDLLREAAALMRERAQAAILGSRWNTSQQRLDIVTTPDKFIVASATYFTDAAHIASWHPAVALAVANQIDAVLAVHTRREMSRWSTVHRGSEHWDGQDERCTDACLVLFDICGGCGMDECKVIPLFEPIARAYLGRDT